MILSNVPILSALIFLPFLGALVIALHPRAHAARWLALLCAMLEFILSLGLLLDFDTARSAEFQFVERHEWLKSLHVNYVVGLDGLALCLLPASAWLTFMSILSAWNSIRFAVRWYFAAILLLQMATVGVLLALDLILFFIFWELTVIPIFFLIILWGSGSERRNAAMKYVLFMLAGGVALLFAFLLLAQHVQALQTLARFNFIQLSHFRLPAQVQVWIFALLLFGFAVKVPLTPLHSWLPNVALEGPSAVTALIVGVKLGLFALLRFVLALTPTALLEHLSFFKILGAVSLVYGALLALQQSNLRRLLAFSSLSHAGLVTIALASLSASGIQGALLAMVNFTLISASLMLLSGFVQQRTGSTERVHLGGLATKLPHLSACVFFFALASVGLPLLSVFPAQFMILFSVFEQDFALGLVALAAEFLLAAAVLNYLGKAFWGKPNPVTLSFAADLTRRELGVLIVPLILSVVLGLAPQWIINATQHASVQLAARFVQP